MRSKKQGVFRSLIIMFLIGIIGILFLNRSTIFDRIFNTAGESQAAPVVKEKVDQTFQQQLAQLKYVGQQVQVVNHNQPLFTSEDLSIDKGAWQKLSHRDWLGRPQVANALLNISAMPRTGREKLYTKTPGYHVYQFTQNDKQTYLYNRSHLIGYQLTGENNNAQNLITGTAALNAIHPYDNQKSMEDFENQIAGYLRADNHHYVRYRVTPIYRNIERVPRGIELEAASINSNDIRLHVYIFNVQPGWEINYYTGTAIQNK